MILMARSCTTGASLCFECVQLGESGPDAVGVESHVSDSPTRNQFRGGSSIAQVARGCGAE